MAPEIVDLISDDEDDVVPVPGPSSNTHPKAGRQAVTNNTINPALISRPRSTVQIPRDTQADTPSSTPSSHTAQNSPVGDEAPKSIHSPLFVPLCSPELEADDNDNGSCTDRGKGKGRAASIPEIDLSQDPNDESTDNPPPPAVDRSWDYANGEFTEEDALKQAIALSLQEQSPGQDHDQDDEQGQGQTRLGGEGYTSPRYAAAAAATAKPLPDWRSSSSSPVKYPIEMTASASNATPTAPDAPLSSSSSSSTSSLMSTETRPSTAAPNSTTKATPSSELRVSASNLMDGRGADEAPPPSSSTFSLAGLDRRRMEEERLARLKRKHGHGEPQDEQAGGGPSAKIARTTQQRQRTISPPPPIKIKQGLKDQDKNDSVGVATPSKRGGHNALPRDAVSLDDDGDGPNTIRKKTTCYYPDGVALKTYVPGYPAAQTISFASVISPPSHLESALLSSFNWNFDWLFPHFETRRTKFQLVMHAKSPAQRGTIVRDWQGVPNVRLTFPPMGGNVNCMHGKLMLLFYANEAEAVWEGGQRCRLVVPTANLVDFDWGVDSIMENTVWLIDLPLHGPSTAAGRTEPPFQKSLKQFLKAQTVPDDVLRKLDQFDFSKTANYGFVHSIGGVHTGQAWRTTGIGGLGRTLTELGLATRDPIQVDYVTSSVGSLNDEFMQSLYLAAQGDSGLTAYNRRLNKNLSSGSPPGSWKQNFRFYFPSDATVRASRAGPQRAGTICFSMKWWQNPNFPRFNMLDCLSVRDRLLMHNKLLFARYASSVEKSQSGNGGWVYVGSANLSESAWGRLVQDKATKEPRLNCRNWECGVVIPVPAKSSDARESSSDDAGLASFADYVPVPMRYPSESMETKKPWTMSEY
ncbi:putative tyrosyl-DNA phosphodiesterase [Cladophialophora carrionii]|uniref:Putative tyrosyl-DNA phosphodiesterase n=1 Tax=Cladophialophora carrionii TaxID=86049 RepID=A0A1C1CZE6_9EURO|nr:putative tyrosyl-DNA phosphodiesterase [Cladophialophora carrionii]